MGLVTWPPCSTYITWAQKEFCSSLSFVLPCISLSGLPSLLLIEQSLLDLNCSLHQFLNHPKISILINQRDEDIFRYLTNLQVRPKRSFLLGLGEESGPWRWGGIGWEGSQCGGNSTITPTLSRYRISDISPWATKWSCTSRQTPTSQIWWLSRSSSATAQVRGSPRANSSPPANLVQCPLYIFLFPQAGWCLTPPQFAGTGARNLRPTGMGTRTPATASSAGSQTIASQKLTGLLRWGPSWHCQGRPC